MRDRADVGPCQRDGRSVPPLGRNDGDVGPPAQLFVQYGTGEDAQVLRVPLDASGRPASPFAWVGTTFRPSVSVGRVPAGQAAAIRAAADGQDGSPPPAGATLIPSDPDALVRSDGPLTAAAYRIGADGHLRPVSIYDGSPVNRLAPADVTIVLVPTDRPIPDDRRRAKRAAAVALTPVTAVGDAAVGLATLAGAAVMAPVFLVLAVANHKLILI